jgi:hypothetical protein
MAFGRPGRPHEEDPLQSLDVSADFCAHMCLFVRPAAQAAVELGSDPSWPVIEASMQSGLTNLVKALRRVAPDLDESAAPLLARSIRRVLLAGMFDRSMSGDNIRTTVRSLVVTAVARPVAVPA